MTSPEGMRMQRMAAEDAPAGDVTERQERRGLILGFVGVVIFGLTLPFMRVALTGLDPYFVGLGRAILAAAVAAVILAVTRQPFPARKDWPGLAIVSAGTVFGFPLLATLGMQHVPAAHGGVVLAVLPLATAMAGAAMAGERPSRGFWLTGIAGSVAVLIFSIIAGGGVTGIGWGDLLLIGSVICAAVGYAQSGVLARHLGGWQVISWALVLTSPAIVVTTFILSGPIDWRAPPEAWLAYLYLALMSQYFGFFFWNRGMVLAGVAKTGQLQLLQPFVTLFVSSLMLGEAVGLHHIVFALIVVGLVARGRRMHVDRKPAP
jgi:drug/metabolite transporter (DMT)-like permease